MPFAIWRAVVAGCIATSSLASVSAACNLTWPATGYTTTTNLAYGTDPLQQLDLYVPVGVTNPIVILDIHGGGFKPGVDKSSRSRYAGPEAQNGFAVAEVNYRLSTWNGTTSVDPFPAANEDLRCAVAWLRQNAAALGINATKVGAVGYSSGGTLAAFLGVHAQFNDPACAAINAGFSPEVDAVVAYYGVFDFLTTSGVEEQVGTLPGTGSPYLDPSTTATGQAASPVSYVSSTAAPMRLVHGSLDTTVAPITQVNEFWTALKNAGASVFRDEQEGLKHAFNPWNYAGYADPMLAASTCATVAFLQTHLK